MKCLLAFADNLWLERRVPILGNLYIHYSIAAIDTFTLISIAIITAGRAMGFLIAKVITHLGFHRFFNCISFFSLGTMIGPYDLA